MYYLLQVAKVGAADRNPAVSARRLSPGRRYAVEEKRGQGEGNTAAPAAIDK